MRNVLVGVDGSHGAIAALRWAGWFAAATHCRLHVANAWQQGAPIDADPDAAVPAGSEIDVVTEAQLEMLVRAELPTQAVEHRVLAGSAAHALEKEAARIDADLLVVGARGAGGALRRMLGSVSQHLTERPARTVAVVPDHHAADELTSPWKVIVGVDGSAGSSRAVRWAATTAQRGAAEVVAVHALEPPVPDPSRSERASLEAEAAQRLDEEWCAPLRLREVEHRSVVLDGAPAEVIRSVCEAESPACVVLGSRGLGSISQRLLGSVTHALVRESDVTTVIVPAPRDCVTWQC